MIHMMNTLYFTPEDRTDRRDCVALLYDPTPFYLLTFYLLNVPQKSSVVIMKLNT